MLTGTKELMRQQETGEFVRAEDVFRDWVRADGSTRVRRQGTVPSLRFVGVSMGASYDHRA